MSNDEYQQQSFHEHNIILDKKAFEYIKEQLRLMDTDLLIFGECAYHYPSFKRVHPLDINRYDKDNNI
jgi:hypothetical protein